MAFDIPAAEPSPEDLARECGDAADNAVEWVQSMSGIALDFSPPSLVALDRVLQSLIPTLTDDDQEPTVILLGSYLGEVFLRACGGRWETGDVFAGPGIRGLGGKEITISPFAKIRQAFTKMESQHLSSYWNSVVERMKNGETLDDIVGFRPPPESSALLLPLYGQGQKKHSGPSDEELAKIIPEETKKFIQILKSDIGVELDLTLDSLRFLDYYFRSLNDAMQKEGRMGERRVFIYLAGNYLGEVLRKAFGGKWVYVPEQQTTGLVLKGGGEDNTIYPHKAAAKLAFEYKENGVVSYVETIKKKLAQT